MTIKSRHSTKHCWMTANKRYSNKPLSVYKSPVNRLFFCNPLIRETDFHLFILTRTWDSHPSFVYESKYFYYLYIGLTCFYKDCRNFPFSSVDQQMNRILFAVFLTAFGKIPSIWTGNHLLINETVHDFTFRKEPCLATKSLDSPFIL